MIELPQYILDYAAKMAAEAQAGTLSLPAEIPQSAQFFLAEEGDSTIIAFDSITTEGRIFKIGTKK
jgi:hypothetical protein